MFEANLSLYLELNQKHKVENRMILGRKRSFIHLSIFFG
jgi:hypothetical protein